MRHEIYISSCASWLPDVLTPVVVGLTKGEYSQKDFDTMGYQSIAIAPSDISVESMATYAAQRALDQANISGEQLAMLTFNGIHRHGHPQLWCPASYLQHQLSAEEALPLSIYQGCNGQLLSISMLSQILQTSKKTYALAVTADNFSLGGINRWCGDYGIVYGDAATAVVLSKTKGIARIISCNTVSDPSLEALHRFNLPFSSNDLALSYKQYNVRATKKAFLKTYGKDVIINATKKAIAKLWKETFTNNNLSPNDINYFIFPNLSEEVLDENYFSVFPQIKERSLWNVGRTLGHLGASDVAVSVDYLFKNSLLKTGDKVLCVGAGSGFSWTFIVIEKV